MLDPEGFEVISFPDGQYKFAMGQENFVNTLAERFPPERNGLKTYMENLRKICTSVSLYALQDERYSIFGDYNLSTGAADYIQSVIADYRLRNIIAGNNLLYAGHERKTPLFTHALINHSFIESAWRVVDGSHKIVNILADAIVKNGGTIIRGNKVQKLIPESGRINRALLSNGEFVTGNHFIANIHPDQLIDMTEEALLKKAFGARIRRLEDTMGMFTLYLVFKKNCFPYINYNFYHYNQDNVWVASDYRPEKWPQNYLLMTTATSGSERFAESGTVITYMDYGELKKWEHTFTGDRGDDYLEFKERKVELLLNSVQNQFPGIRNCIEAWYTSTPLTWRDYTGTRAGSAYGILKDYNRPLESVILPTTKIPNLFLTGQNTNVHGILGVTISSVVTCGELIDIRYLINKIKNA
jgi:all-trans-retinol 13,14-reductase